MATTAVTENKWVGIITRIRRARLPWVPIVILMFFVITAVFAPLVTPHSPYEPNLPNRLMPPAWQSGGSSEHFLGTDTLGRDLLTRIFYGSRISLTVAIVVAAFGGALGLSLGIIAGYAQRITGAVIMRIVDSLIAIPTVLLAIIFTMILRPGMDSIILAISLLIWARIARIINGDVLTVMKRDFILQAKVAGCSGLRIIAVHIFPNVFNTFMVLISLEISHVVLMEATLSFLGVGIPPPTPSWGQMVSEGRGYITSAWWITFFPGLALALIVFALNTFGDWLRDKLDPTLRQL